MTLLILFHRSGFLRARGKSHKFLAKFAVCGNTVCRYRTISGENGMEYGKLRTGGIQAPVGLNFDLEIKKMY